MPTKTMSFVGSTQNQVPAAPSQKKVPLPTGSFAAAGRKRRLLGVVEAKLAAYGNHNQLAIFYAVVGRKTRLLLLRHEEAGVLHPKRIEDVIAHEIGKRLSGELLHQIAFNVHRKA